MTEKTTPKRKFSFSRMARITGSGVMWFVTAIIAVGLMLSSWGGLVDAERHGFFGVVVLSLPIWVPLMIVVFVINVMWFKRQAVVCGLTLAMCLPTVFDVFPAGLGLRGLRPGEKELSWTMMTYNCACGVDQSGQYIGDINPTYRIIRDTAADVVCLQEWDVLAPQRYIHLYSEQIDSLRLIYPYIIEGPDRMLLLSHFPARQLNMGYDGDEENPGEMTAYELDMGHGHMLTVISVHLQSIGLTVEDKQFYGELTRPGEIDEYAGSLSEARRTVGRIRANLVSKLDMAGRARARQAQKVVKFIRSCDSENIILCGDFNDVPGCYTMRAFESLGLRQVYSVIGRGYLPTFNRDRFLFRIDHMLWRGDLMPRSIYRINDKASDHYPLVTRWVWKR